MRTGLTKREKTTTLYFDERSMLRAADDFAEQGSFLRQEARSFNQKAEKAEKTAEKKPAAKKSTASKPAAKKGCK